MTEQYQYTATQGPPAKVYTIYNGDMINGATDVYARLLSVPICPDLLDYDAIGEADNWRGKIVRGFFWLLRIWSA